MLAAGRQMLMDQAADCASGCCWSVEKADSHSRLDIYLNSSSNIVGFERVLSIVEVLSEVVVLASTAECAALSYFGPGLLDFQPRLSVDGYGERSLLSGSDSSQTQTAV